MVGKTPLDDAVNPPLTRYPRGQAAKCQMTWENVVAAARVAGSSARRDTPENPRFGHEVLRRVALIRQRLSQGSD